MERFGNTETGIKSYEIDRTGDYLIRRGSEWYYWIGDTPTTDNHGPYPSRKEALKAWEELNARSEAARALRAIPSDRRAEQSRINGRHSAEPGKKGGRPRRPK